MRRPAGPWGPKLGLAVLALSSLASAAQANAPNFYMLLGTAPALFATVPLTIVIEAAVIRKFSDFSWGKAIAVACLLYILSTSLGSYIGGGIMFAIHPIFFEARQLFYETVSTILFGAINFAIEVVVLSLVFRPSLGLPGLAAFFVANLVTTAMLFFVAYSGLF